MSKANKIFPIGAIVYSVLAALGWAIFSGGYGYNTLQINSKLSSEQRSQIIHPYITSTPSVDLLAQVYDANLTGYVPEYGHASAPFYLALIVSPFLIIVFIVTSLLLLRKGYRTVVHSAFQVTIVFLLFVTIPSIGAVVHNLSLAIDIIHMQLDSTAQDLSSYTFVVETPFYITLMIAGGVSELIFLGMTSILLVLGYSHKKSEAKVKEPRRIFSEPNAFNEARDAFNEMEEEDTFKEREDALEERENTFEEREDALEEREDTFKDI